MSITEIYDGKGHTGNVFRVYPDKHWDTLPLRSDLANHSPTGFSWGYPGSGPSQLALAIIADATGEDEAAMRFYMDFKFGVIANLPKGRNFSLPRKAVISWLIANGWVEKHPMYRPVGRAMALVDQIGQDFIGLEDAEDPALIEAYNHVCIAYDSLWHAEALMDGRRTHYNMESDGSEFEPMRRFVARHQPPEIHFVEPVFDD